MKKLFIQHLSYLKNISIGVLLVCLTACSWMHKDKSISNITPQQVKVAPRLVMPQHLNKSKAEDYYPVPSLPKQTTPAAKQPPSLEPPI